MPATRIRTGLKSTGLVHDELFNAAIAMNSACAAYKWVMPGSITGEVTLATGASLGAPIGVLQNLPAAGQVARVRVYGKSFTAACMGACNLAHGTFVTVGSHGNAVPSTCGLAYGRWAGSSVLTTASANLGEVFVFAFGFGTCVPSAS